MPSLRGRIINAGLRAARSNRLLERHLASSEVRREAPDARMLRERRVDVREQDGFAVYTIHPRGGAFGKGAHLHFHGGGFVTGLLRVQLGVYARLADAAGRPVIVPDYPTSLEAGAEEVAAFAERSLSSAREEHGPLTCGGDSAGGTLALLLAQRAAAQGEDIARRLVLWSPWCDLSMRNEAGRAASGWDGVIRYEGLVEAGQRFAGEADPAEARFSPLFGRMKGLPPLTIFAGDRDPLWPDIRLLTERVQAAGVEVDLIVELGLGHYWMFLPQPEARRTIEATAAAIRQA
jgi:acetyl esterase/lipase